MKNTIKSINKSIKTRRKICKKTDPDWTPEDDGDGALFLGIIRVPDYEGSENDVAFLEHARNGYIRTLNALELAIKCLNTIYDNNGMKDGRYQYQVCPQNMINDTLREIEEELAKNS